ncbi:unnamed protein product [Mytilus coruscus]|uniref:Uncharacterized protein n=1 Tax=Mytilus coruscus TaxID=42192 RepID=A0A6J8C7B2_MYTCO|nr:unnamed protein product [Mytilus coruscus]
MTRLLGFVLIDGCIRALDWILDNVDNSLMSFDYSINSLYDCYNIDDESETIGDKLLLILKKVNHKWFNIYNILDFAIDIFRIKYVDQSCLYTENTSRFVDVTNRRIWHGVLELLLNHDSDSSININITITDAFEQLNDHGNGNEDEDEKYMKEIILLIMKKYPNNIDVRNSIMETACQIGCHEIVEECLSKKKDKITYYLNITLDQLQFSTLNSFHIPFYRYHGKILLLLLPMVNLNLFDLDSLMNVVCRIGHSPAALWLLENKPSYPFDIGSVLNKAAYHGDLKFVEYLLLKYNGDDFNYRTAMIKACRNSNENTLDLCKWLWENNDRCLFDMKASLNNASRCDNTEVVEWILTEVDKGLLDTEAAFLLACEHGEYDTVELLLDASSINMLDIQSAMIIACRNENNNLSITELLYKSADQSTINLNAVFSAACKNYRIDIVQWIIETCDQNITVTETKDGNKHFIKSLDKNRVDMDQAVTCILDMDAHEQKEDHVNEIKIQLLRLILNKLDPSIIHIYKLLTEACKNDWIEVFQWILGSVDHACLNIGEIINVACQNGAFNIIKWSLETIDMQLVDADNVMVESCGFGWLECLFVIWKQCNQYKLQAAMTEACIYGRLHIAEWLVQNVHCQLFNIPMLLQEAGRNGWIDIFGWLLENFHFEKSDMHIATSQALENGHLKIAELVISTVGKECFSFSSLSDNAYVGANKEGVVNFLLHNIDHRSIDIATIMTNACLFGWKDIATFIVDNDLSSLCDLSLAFNAACDNGELEIVQLLLEKVGPRILTTVDKAMHSVAVKGWDEIALLLLDKVEHTRLNIGNTLIEACRHGEIDIVQAILWKVKRTMLDVKTALYKACENHMHEELVLLILENIDQEQVDLKTVKIQAIRHKWREVQFALTKVDTENLKQFEEEDATDNIIFLE